MALGDADSFGGLVAGDEHEVAAVGLAACRAPAPVLAGPEKAASPAAIACYSTPQSVQLAQPGSSRAAAVHGLPIAPVIVELRPLSGRARPFTWGNQAPQAALDGSKVSFP